MVMPHSARSRALFHDARSVVHLTGWTYFPLAFLGRLPFSMMIVGLLTLVTITRESLAEAGMLAAVAGLGTASTGMLAGSLADRIGQRTVLLVGGGLSVGSAAGMLALSSANAPLPSLAVAALLLGATTPQVAPFSRSRLVLLTQSADTSEGRERTSSVVMSYESFADEASYVVGPVIVGATTAAIAPWAPLALSMMLTATVIGAFALHPSGTTTSPRLNGSRATQIGGLKRTFTPFIILLIVAMLLVGTVFGATLTGLTAFMAARGQAELAGLAYGMMSAGAIVSALGSAVLPTRVSLRLRWTVFGLLAWAGTAVLALSASLELVFAALFLSGCGVGAVLVALFSLGTAAAPSGRTNTILTTLQSTLVVGQALVTGIAGTVAEFYGATTAFAIAAAASLLITVLSLIPVPVATDRLSARIRKNSRASNRTAKRRGGPTRG